MAPPSRAALQQQLQLGRHFAEVWNSDTCAIALKKRIARTLIDEIARVLSKLGRRTGKGNRWSEARVATVRRKHSGPAPALERWVACA